MKALKVIFSILLGIIMFFLVGAFGIITSVRIILSGNSIGNIIEDVAKETDEINIGELFSQSGSVSTSELNKAMDDLEEYISKEELYDIFGDFCSQFIRYNIGAIDEIDNTSVKDALKEVAEKYEEKTGEKVDLEEAFASIDKATEEAESEIKSMDKSDREKLEILGYFYHNGIYFGIIAAFAFCALLIILINKSVIPLLIHLIIIAIFNGIGNVILFVTTKIISTDDKVSQIIFNDLGGLFLKIAICCGISIIIFIIGLVIANKMKKKPQPVMQ